MKYRREVSNSINITTAKTEEELATLFIAELDLPDLYKHSIHGIAEHLFYDPEMKIPLNLIIKGFSSFSMNSPKISEEFIRCLEEHTKNNEDGFNYTVE